MRDGVVEQCSRTVPHPNAHRHHRAPRKHSLRGWFCGRGVSRKARRGVGIYYPARMRGQHLPPIPWRTPVQIRMTQCYRCMLYSPAHTLCTNRPGWTRYNWLLCRRTYSPMGTNCSRWSWNPRPPQHNPTGTMLMVPRQMHQPVQSPISQK